MLALDVEHIMRLGGWESLDMVVRYTKSVKFEESLKLYRELGPKTVNGYAVQKIAMNGSTHFPGPVQID